MPAIDAAGTIHRPTPTPQPTPTAQATPTTTHDHAPGTQPAGGSPGSSGPYSSLGSDNAVLRGAQGTLIHTGYVGTHDGALRAEYQRRVAGVGSGPDASALRKDIRTDIRARSTHFGRAYAEYLGNSAARTTRLAAKTPAELAASAVRSNAGVNALGDGMRVGGKAMLGVGLALSAYDIATAPPDQRLKVTTQEAGSWAGALAVGEGGATLGAELGTLIAPGPGTVIGAAAGGLLGGAIGAFGGEKAVDAVWNWATGH